MPRKLPYLLATSAAVAFIGVGTASASTPHAPRMQNANRSTKPLCPTDRGPIYGDWCQHSANGSDNPGYVAQCPTPGVVKYLWRSAPCDLAGPPATAKGKVTAEVPKVERHPHLPYRHPRPMGGVNTGGGGTAGGSPVNLPVTLAGGALALTGIGGLTIRRVRRLHG